MSATQRVSGTAVPAVVATKLPIVRKALAGQFPTLPLNEEWLRAATTYILESAPGSLSSMSVSELVQGVTYQALHADLASLLDPSAVASTSTGADDGGKYPAFSPAAVRATKLKNPAKGKGIANVAQGRLAAPSKTGGNTGVVVQIVGMTDIGISAQVQLDVALARKEAAKTVSGRAMLEAIVSGEEQSAEGGRARGRTQSASPTKKGKGKIAASGSASASGSGGAGAQDAGAAGDPDDAYLAAEEDAMRAALRYPRAMLSLELDDGTRIAADSGGKGKQRALDADGFEGGSKLASETQARFVRAIEMEQIPDLAMGKTQLGCKILLRDVEIADGVLLLRKSNVVVKGGTVVELADAAQDKLIARLRGQLGLPDEDGAGGRRTKARPSAASDRLPPVRNASAAATARDPPAHSNGTPGQRLSTTAGGRSAERSTGSHGKRRDGAVISLVDDEDEFGVDFDHGQPDDQFSLPDEDEEAAMREAMAAANSNAASRKRPVQSSGSTVRKVSTFDMTGDDDEVVVIDSDDVDMPSVVQKKAKGKAASQAGARRNAATMRPSMTQAVKKDKNDVIWID